MMDAQTLASLLIQLFQTVASLASQLFQTAWSQPASGLALGLVLILASKLEKVVFWAGVLLLALSAAALAAGYLGIRL